MKKIIYKLIFIAICLVSLPVFSTVKVDAASNAFLSIAAWKDGTERTDALSVIEGEQITIKIYEENLVDNGTFTLNYNSEKFTLVDGSFLHHQSYDVSYTADPLDPGVIHFTANVLTGLTPDLTNQIATKAELCSISFNAVGISGIERFLLTPQVVDDNTYDIESNPAPTVSVRIILSSQEDNNDTFTPDGSTTTDDETGDDTSGQSNTVDTSNSPSSSPSVAVRTSLGSDLPLTGMEIDNSYKIPKITKVSFGDKAAKDATVCSGLFLKGTAEPGGKVNVIFGDIKLSYAVDVDSKGDWSMKIPDNLLPRAYKISLYSEKNNKFSKPNDTEVIFRLPCRDNVVIGSVFPDRSTKYYLTALLLLSVLTVAVFLYIRKKRR